jgi:hypothetical protein
MRRCLLLVTTRQPTDNWLGIGYLHCEFLAKAVPRARAEWCVGVWVSRPVVVSLAV